jgi:beta-N-acetylhexosaminidase
VSTSNIEAAGQALVVGFPENGPGKELVALAKRGALGGFILFKRNLGTPIEVAKQNSELASFAPSDRPLMLSVDQEGGRVARLKAPVLTLPAMRRLAALGDKELLRRAGKVLGQNLRALGFTLDFAPVLDVDTNPKNPVIGDRSFGTNAKDVIDYAYAFADGLKDADVLSCGKHFPGHGDTDLDSHLDLPVLRHERDRLDEIELAPFREARGRIPSLMTAHVVFEAFDAKVPATLSPRVITELLRRELRYDGAVFSDDLEMKAVADRYAIADSARLAILAGCDILLVCSKPELALEAHEALTKEAEKSSAFKYRLEEAAGRSLDLRKKASAPKAICIPKELDAELALGGAREELEREIETRLERGE